MKNGDWKKKNIESHLTHNWKSKKMCYKRKEMNINCVKTKESPRVKNGESERGWIAYVMKILKFMLFYS